MTGTGYTALDKPGFWLTGDAQAGNGRSPLVDAIVNPVAGAFFSAAHFKDRVQRTAYKANLNIGLRYYDNGLIETPYRWYRVAALEKTGYDKPSYVVLSSHNPEHLMGVDSEDSDRELLTDEARSRVALEGLFINPRDHAAAIAECIRKRDREAHDWDPQSLILHDIVYTHARRDSEAEARGIVLKTNGEAAYLAWETDTPGTWAVKYFPTLSKDPHEQAPFIHLNEDGADIPTSNGFEVGYDLGHVQAENLDQFIHQDWSVQRVPYIREARPSIVKQDETNNRGKTTRRSVQENLRAFVKSSNVRRIMGIKVPLATGLGVISTLVVAPVASGLGVVSAAAGGLAFSSSLAVSVGSDLLASVTQEYMEQRFPGLWGVCPNWLRSQFSHEPEPVRVMRKHRDADDPNLASYIADPDQDEHSWNWRLNSEAVAPHNLRMLDDDEAGIRPVNTPRQSYAAGGDAGEYLMRVLHDLHSAQASYLAPELVYYRSARGVVAVHDTAHQTVYATYDPAYDTSRIDNQHDSQINSVNLPQCVPDYVMSALNTGDGTVLRVTQETDPQAGASYYTDYIAGDTLSRVFASELPVARHRINAYYFADGPIATLPERCDDSNTVFYDSAYARRVMRAGTDDSAAYGHNAADAKAVTAYPDENNGAESGANGNGRHEHRYIPVFHDSESVCAHFQRASHDRIAAMKPPTQKQKPLVRPDEAISSYIAHRQIGKPAIAASRA